jgi:hypothetical protein
VELDRETVEKYQAFMSGYVRRINQATFRVIIGGVRIGTAKYTRLAQINLKSRIITFSRYAIENVPERGRRYLVLHELAHVKEASHNKRFWNFVGQFEPDYRKIGHNLENAFRLNVKADEASKRKSGLFLPKSSGVEKQAPLAGLLGQHFSAQQRTLAGKAALAPDAHFSKTLSAPNVVDLNKSRQRQKQGFENTVNQLTLPLNQAPAASQERLSAFQQAEAFVEDDWEKIQEEMTYWKDDSDEDSDVEMSGGSDDGWQFEEFAD